MGMLQPIAEADHFSHIQTGSTQKGTQVSSKDIVSHVASMVTKQLIAIQERIEKHIMIPTLTFLVTQDVILVTSMDM